MNLIKNSLSLAIVAVLAAASAHAASVTVSSTDPLHIRSGLTNQGRNQHMLVGSTIDNSRIRGLFTFDFSSTGIDFSKVSIDNVTINLTVSRNDSDSADAVVQLNLYQLTQGYVMSEATWTIASSGTDWSPTAGGTYDPNTIVASTSANPHTVVANDVISFTSDALINLITSAGLSGNSADFLIRLDNETAAGRQLFYFGRDEYGYPVANFATPSITIEYTPIPEPSHVGLAIGAAALGLIVLRRRFKRA